MTNLRSGPNDWGNSYSPVPKQKNRADRGGQIKG